MEVGWVGRWVGAVVLGIGFHAPFFPKNAIFLQLTKSISKFIFVKLFLKIFNFFFVFIDLRTRFDIVRDSDDAQIMLKLRLIFS